MINNPLTEEDYKAIQQALDTIPDLRLLMDKMEKCGQECQERKEQLSKIQTELEAYKREFFKRGKPVPIEGK